MKKPPQTQETKLRFVIRNLERTLMQMQYHEKEMMKELELDVLSEEENQLD